MRFSTMKSVRIQIVSLILAGLVSIPTHAEVIPGRWEKISQLANQHSDFSAGGKLYFTMIGAAVGLGVGLMTDSAIKSKPIVLYKAPERP